MSRNNDNHDNIVDDDGFTLVTRNNRRRRGRRRADDGRQKTEQPNSNMRNVFRYRHDLKHNNNNNNNADISHLFEFLQRWREQINSNEFLSQVLEIISSQLETQITKIISFGLGDISDSRTSLCQLAFLSLMKDKYNCRTEVYDPVMFSHNGSIKSECSQLLKSSDIHIIDQNEECYRRVTEPTLFFMPHCGKRMYSNLIYANLKDNQYTLNHVVILGNNLKDYEIRTFKDIKEDPSYVSKMHHFLYSFPLKNTFSAMPEAFNDLAITTFPANGNYVYQNLGTELVPEPKDDDDPEIQLAQYE